jgi:hypothetical protein
MRRKILSTLAITLLALAFAGCRTNKDQACCSTSMTNSTASTVAPAPAAPAPAPVMAMTQSEPAPKLAPPIRIKAGAGDAFKDADGNQWIPEQGFTEGDTAERPDVEIANTKTPQIYRSEHYSMTSFSLPVPNGKYIVKLHFCETYDGIEGPGQRVFSFNVEGHQFNDFDVWVKAGGPLRAYIETVPVEVADGKLDITFTPKVENPQINGIEILPAS